MTAVVCPGRQSSINLGHRLLQHTSVMLSCACPSVRVSARPPYPLVHPAHPPRARRGTNHSNGAKGRKKCASDYGHFHGRKESGLAPLPFANATQRPTSSAAAVSRPSRAPGRCPGRLRVRPARCERRCSPLGAQPVPYFTIADNAARGKVRTH